MVDDMPIVEDDVETTGEPTVEELKMDEAAILAGALGAAKDKENYGLVVIARPQPDGTSKTFFRFRVKGYEDKVMRKMMDSYTPKIKNRQGLMVSNLEGFKNPEFLTHFIYEATHPEDKKALWDNSKLQDTLEVKGWRATIDKVLKAGEKDTVADIIGTLSGYGAVTGGVELIKNL